MTTGDSGDDVDAGVGEFLSVAVMEVRLRPETVTTTANSLVLNSIAEWRATDLPSSRDGDGDEDAEDAEAARCRRIDSSGAVPTRSMGSASSANGGSSPSDLTRCNGVVDPEGGESAFTPVDEGDEEADKAAVLPSVSCSGGSFLAVATASSSI